MCFGTFRLLPETPGEFKIFFFEAVSDSVQNPVEPKICMFYEDLCLSGGYIYL